MGNLLAAAFRPLPEPALRAAHFGVWSAHGLLAFGFIALVPQSKAFHMVSSSVSIFLRNLGAVGALPAGDPAGVATMRDFTWRQLLQFDACTWCGRCQEQCPAHASGMPLSPKDLVLKLDQQLIRGAKPASGGNGAAGAVATLHDGTVGTAELWACTTCLACEQVCAVLNEQPRAIVDLRRHLVSQGTVDKTVQDMLANLNRYGNSFGKSDRMRAKWTQPLATKIKDARKEPVEYLWFVGDYASYDPRLEDITRKTAEIFQQAGLDFGLLYEGERNAGNDVRRVGEEGLFEMLRDKNLQALAKAQFKTIVTTDPHTYNTLKNEYPWNGNAVTVLHYTEVLDQLLDGRAAAAEEAAHGPRDLPRSLLPRPLQRRLRPAAPRAGRRWGSSWWRCRATATAATAAAPAAGGSGWRTCPGSRSARPRAASARSPGWRGVSTLVVSCPKDIAMFRDAVKTTGNEGKIVVKDLAELVWEAMQGNREGTTPWLIVERAVTCPTDTTLETLLATPEGQQIMTCLQCGTCAGTCPYGEYMEYPPRAIINMLWRGLLDEVITSDSLLRCVACYACLSKCPRGIRLTDVLLPLVKEQTLANLKELPAELQKSLENMSRYGNPMGESPRKRAAWAATAGVPVRNLAEKPGPVDVLWFVECYTSFYPRGQDEQPRHGEAVPRAGRGLRHPRATRRSAPASAGSLTWESGLFETLTEANMKTLQASTSSTASSPAIRTPSTPSAAAIRWPSMGWQVEHTTLFLARHLDQLQAQAHEEARGQGHLPRHLLPRAGHGLLRRAARAARRHPRRDAGRDGRTTASTRSAAAAAAAGCGWTPTTSRRAWTGCPSGG